ncbi:MAG: GntR family transcriptional regulator [Verrucomicrobiae bacterium]|nr:GntR family transcriptional regulator [Verrucomicrobiae bacterium]
MRSKFTLLQADPADVQIERFLRGQIQSGALGVGEQLPTTEDLVKEWHVGRTTVNRVMRRLVAEGLLSRSRKRGTFVRSIERQVSIAVLVAPSLIDETAHFYRAMLRGICAGGRKRGWKCRIYDGLNKFRVENDFDHEAAGRRFQMDVRNDSFKGLVDLHSGWVHVPEVVKDVPLVRLGPSLAKAPVDVTQDCRRFGRESVEFLAKKGCTRMVYLRFVDRAFVDDRDLKGIQAAVAAAGLPKVEVREIPYPLLASGMLEELAFTRMMELLHVWRENNSWPDALLISDDIAARGAAMAMLQEESGRARKLPVVVKANAGITHSYGLPFARYDFSGEAIAGALLDVLWLRISGGALPPLPVEIGGVIQYGTQTLKS